MLTHVSNPLVEEVLTFFVTSCVEMVKLRRRQVGNCQVWNCTLDFNNSLFYYPREIIFINDNKLLLADTFNHSLRVLNQQTSNTSSVCRESVGHIDGDMDTCTLCYPHSLMVLNDTLYVEEYQRIRKVQG